MKKLIMVLMIALCSSNVFADQLVHWTMDMYREHGKTELTKTDSRKTFITFNVPAQVASFDNLKLNYKVEGLLSPHMIIEFEQGNLDVSHKQGDKPSQYTVSIDLDIYEQIKSYSVSAEIVITEDDESATLLGARYHALKLDDLNNKVTLNLVNETKSLNPMLLPEELRMYD